MSSEGSKRPPRPPRPFQHPNLFEGPANGVLLGAWVPAWVWVVGDDLATPVEARKAAAFDFPDDHPQVALDFLAPVVFIKDEP